jgi:hypothetical protein
MDAEGDVMTDSYDEWRKRYEADRDRNKRSFAEQRELIRRDYAGKWVGFAFGRVIATDPDMNKVIAAMEALDPQPESEAVFRAEDEPVFDIVESYGSEFITE